MSKAITHNRPSGRACYVLVVHVSLCMIYTEPKKKLSQNRTSRWAYSLRKKKKSTPTSNETEISNEINDFQTVHEL